MRSYTLVSAVCLLLLVASSQQLGTLFVNNIRGNSDTNFVKIEDVIIDGNTMKVDFIDGLTTAGVLVERVKFQDGSVTVPENLLVDKVATIQGLFNFNGGMRADDGAEGASFTVEDNTGVTTIAGELRPNGGINVDNRKFEVKPSGETTIAEAVLRPNGGINSNDGQFTVSATDGSAKTRSELVVQQNIVLGTTNQEVRKIHRLPTDAATGGPTVIQGQSGITLGGDLQLIPGLGFDPANAFRNGRIVVGRAAPDELEITRASTAGATAGLTRFDGQDSTTRTGGNLELRAGSSGSTTFNGGNIILAPGSGTAHGDIILGIPGTETTSNNNLVIRRPDRAGGNAGSTTIRGQDALASDGGDLRLQAGSGTGTGGALILEPGYGTGIADTGDIRICRANNDHCRFARETAESGNAGLTTFKGQDSAAGHGGDIAIVAGDGGAGATNGGDVRIVTGEAAGTGRPGRIVWGNAKENLIVQRPPAQVGVTGTTTTIQGQDSAVGNGGDLTLISGTGALNSGNLNINSGAATAGTAGSIAIAAGDSTLGQGGSVTITAGDAGAGANGGDVSITAGNGNAAGFGGNLILEGGTTGGTGAGTRGQVIVGPSTQQFLVDSANVVIKDGKLRITREGVADSVELSANPEAILTVNGNIILKERQKNGMVAFQQQAISDAEINFNVVVNNLQQTLNSLVRALGPCGHGLFNVIDSNNNLVTVGTDAFCQAPGPTPITAFPLTNAIITQPGETQNEVAATSDLTDASPRLCETPAGATQFDRDEARVITAQPALFSQVGNKLEPCAQQDTAGMAEILQDWNRKQ